MIALLLALAFLGQAQAQEPSTEQASQAAAVDFARLLRPPVNPNGGYTLPTWKEVEEYKRQKQLQDLAKPPSGSASSDPAAQPDLNRWTDPGLRNLPDVRDIRHSVDVYPLHLGGRVDIGGGWTLERFVYRGYPLSEDQSKYAGIRINLGRRKDADSGKPTKLVSPSGTYTTNEASSKPYVSRHDYDEQSVRQALKNGRLP